jgi:ABC-2 type transport system ATP-binding protein
VIIDVQNLRKTFRTRSRPPVEIEAVKGIDVRVEQGQIFGVLGPNGAGKSTTIRMLATLIKPSAGTGTVAGHDLIEEPEKVRASIGYVSQAGGVDDNNGPRANLLLAARLGGLSAGDAGRRVTDMLEAFDLDAFADRPARTLSGGQKRRVALALGLINRPPLLFLDEPTTGLDPQNRVNLWDQIRALREQGTSVLLSTHYLDEADSLCDRLMIVDHGEIVAEGTADELKQAVAGDVVTFRIPGLPPVAAEIEKAVQKMPFTRETQTEDDLLRIYLDGGEQALPLLLQFMADQKLIVQAVSLDRATLDDVFLRRTGRSLRDAD